MRPVDVKTPGLQLGVHHFALFRGQLDGLPLEALAERYLETGRDLKQARRTLNWVRAELVAAARRYAHETGLTQSSFARLLRIEPERMERDERVALSEMPSLEEFQAEHDPAGFWSEAELVAEFQQRYASKVTMGAMRKAERNARLRKRARQALTILEKWLATTPKESDPLSIWFHPLMAARLCVPQTGILTIGDLVHWINTRGNLWHRRIPGFGPTKARRVVSWLQINQVLPLNEFALVPYRVVKDKLSAARPQQTGIVPLEHLALPAGLDGKSGLNRGKGNRLSADDDKAAIEAWIAVKAADNRNTARSYRSQAERFLLWMLFERDKALSSATAEDCAAYGKFLVDLGSGTAEWNWRISRRDWIAGKAAKRWHPDWRPFTGELTLASRRQAITVIKGLFAFLTRSRYLEHDPWNEIATPKRSGKRLNVHRILTPDQWQAVLDELDGMERGEAYYRLRLAVWLLYTSGLRLFELVGLRVANLKRTPYGDWELHLLGKGEKEREIPLAESVMDMVSDYFEARGLGRTPANWAAATPILATLEHRLQHVATPGKALADSSLFKLLKRHFEIAAERLDDLIDANQLRRASTHWLRHTFATEALAQGAGQDVVQELMGHADPATTVLYVHASRDRKRAAVEALAAKQRRG